MWDADQYLKFSDERARPFFDLLARIPPNTIKTIADLGCGPGNLTRALAERWPQAHVVGVDNSAEMLSQVRSHRLAGRLDFIQADITQWSPSAPIDLVFTNAALQWVDGHEELLTRLVTMMSPRGVLAVQVPYHFQNPAHLVIEETKRDARWAEQLSGVGLHQQSVMPLTWYIDRLHDIGLKVDAWQTTYIHVLTGEDPVLEWFKGSALRPLLSRLDTQQTAAFLKELGQRLRDAYPRRGQFTLLPFPRLFFVATRN